MREFWLHIPFEQQCLLGVLLLLLIYQVYFYLRYMLLRTEHRQDVNEVPQDEDKEPHFVQLDLFAPAVKGVSVIVAARNESDNLRHFLHALLEQDYPLFEVIVVNDGSLDNTAEVLEEYQHKYRHMRTTFVPCQARVISSKKLALSLAVKAARYKYLLLTDADCRPESRLWIREMMKGFEDGEQTDIVLGYGAYFPSTGHVGRLTQYETLFTGLQYMGFARAGHAYMGVGRNLAYRKDLFVEHNGFSGFIGAKAGDDDLFVNHTATDTNTAVVSTPESVTWSIPKTSFRDWYQQRRRHLSVSPMYRFDTKLRLTIEPVTRGLMYVALVVLLAVGTWQVKVIAAAVYLVRLLLQYVIMHNGARRLGGATVPCLSIVWFDVMMPLLTLWLMAFPQRKNQYW